MARYDVFADESGQLLLDVQADLLRALSSRVVVPLLSAEAFKPALRLNPIFEIDGRELVMATQYIAAIPEKELAQKITTLEGSRFEITQALDMLFSGF